MCACDFNYVCAAHRDTREDDSWDEPEPVLQPFTERESDSG